MNSIVFLGCYSVLYVYNNFQFLLLKIRRTLEIVKKKSSEFTHYLDNQIHFFKLTKFSMKKYIFMIILKRTLLPEEFQKSNNHRLGTWNKVKNIKKIQSIIRIFLLENIKQYSEFKINTDVYETASVSGGGSSCEIYQNIF